MGPDAQHLARRAHHLVKAMRESELRRLAGRETIPLGILEKDYVLTIVLYHISRLPYAGQMAFKGGTCIKKIYFADARFSIDLDFSCLSNVVPKLLEDLRVKLEGKEVFNINFTEVFVEEERQNAVRLSVKHLDMRGHPTSVKLDLSLRERISLKPELKPVLNVYDLSSFSILALKLEEILAEKIRAVIARGTPRDIYDVWFLLRKGVPFQLELVNEKLSLLKYDKSFSPELFLERVEERREIWERDLSILLPEVPPFEEVKKAITKAISQS